MVGDGVSIGGGGDGGASIRMRLEAETDEPNSIVLTLPDAKLSEMDSF